MAAMSPHKPLLLPFSFFSFFCFRSVSTGWVLSMENLVSTWFHQQSLPDNYVFPLEKRPGKSLFPLRNTIPVIDLGGYDRTDIARRVSNACQEYGFFQVINHGIGQRLMEETMSVIKEFHAMEVEDKSREGSRDPKRRCRLYTSSQNYETEEVHYWRDALTHPCYPLDDCIKFWPQKPARYRDVIREYSEEVRKLCKRILEMICEGLGLNPKSLDGELSQCPTMVVNHYPPCPEPSLTLGLAKHRDPSLITIVLQENVAGLQVLKDGEWISVEPISNALVVNIGYLLQVISNGKLKGAEHRVVTNSKVARTTASLFIYPSGESVIQPLLSASPNKQSSYSSFQFKDFLSHFISISAEAKSVNSFLTSKHNSLR